MNFHLLLLWFNSDDASKLLVMMNVDSIWISAPKVSTGEARHLLDISAPNLKSDQNKQQTITSVINIYQLREIEA